MSTDSGFLPHAIDANCSCHSFTYYNSSTICSMHQHQCLVSYITIILVCNNLTPTTIILYITSLIILPLNYYSNITAHIWACLKQSARTTLWEYKLHTFAANFVSNFRTTTTRMLKLTLFCSSHQVAHVGMLKLICSNIQERY